MRGRLASPQGLKGNSMEMMEGLRRRAAGSGVRIAFYEPGNERILRAAAELTEGDLAVCVLVGDGEAVRAAATAAGVDLAGMEIVDVADEARVEALAQAYEALPSCRFKPRAVRRRAGRAIDHAFMMQAVGEVDVTFGGIDCPTGDVIAAGQTYIGLEEGVVCPSSIGIFDIPGYSGPEGTLLAFGDSAVCVSPTSEQLASIAVSAAGTVSALLDWEPRVALLSYSTDGSAESELVSHVREAVRIAREKRPDLAIDGEFQLDAAIRPEIAAKKVRRESAVAGRANVVIWPDINVGNIGVKLVQGLAGADAYGPILQGFRKVVCDCSRSAPVSELVGNAVMSCVRARAMREGASDE